MDYTMTVEIPVKEVPSEVSIQEAKIISEIWLKNKIPDAELIEFKECYHLRSLCATIHKPEEGR